eukprot:TRINITY_DN605_c0_g1_i1.p2 TRINITY_DN605_c0_g1~~TRINITY_DN605_c0_g1_i1.p2  ORF type:complete len:278 (+),score=74.62 TRINITY_DN605_c0_g1_i1:2233-3066(+)
MDERMIEREREREGGGGGVVEFAFEKFLDKTHMSGQSTTLCSSSSPTNLCLSFCILSLFLSPFRNYKLMGSVDKFSQSIGNRVRKVIKSSEEETSKPKKATVDLEEVTIEEAENKAENVQTGFIILEAIVELIVAWLRTLFTTALLFSSFSTVLPNISIEALQLEFNITFPALGDFLVGVLSILNSLNLYDAFEFTCLESTSALMPLVTMIGFVLLRVLFEADILLGIIMLLKSIKKRFVDSALPLRLLMNFFCGIGAGVMVYAVRISSKEIIKLTL